MAAQVLSGSGNVSYTNSTGQNVRLVINYFEVGNLGGTPVVSFPGGSITVPQRSTYGKALGYQKEGTNQSAVSNMAVSSEGFGNLTGLPLEIALANGDTFSITQGSGGNIKGYNIIIIPEAG